MRRSHTSRAALVAHCACTARFAALLCLPPPTAALATLLQQDTLSSPRQQLMGALPEMLQRAASGVVGSVASLWGSSKQQQQQQGAPPPLQHQQQQDGNVLAPIRPGGIAGRPPIPPGSRPARATTPGAAASPLSRKRGGGAAQHAQHAQQQQQQQQHDSGSPDPAAELVDFSLPDASGLSTAAATAVQDSLAAATNLPGTQDTTAAAAAAVAALPPELAGYYRWPGASLLGCLSRFTHAEQLGTGEKWACERWVFGGRVSLFVGECPCIVAFVGDAAGR